MRIEIKNISKSYGKRILFQNFSYTIEEGERIAVTGKSGSGKTTLLRMIMGVEKPDSGEIVFSEEPRISAVLQDNLLFGQKTVYENLLFVKDIGKDEAERYLEKVKMAGESDMKVSELSGGMKRRTAFVRGLVYSGNLYVFDEVLREVDSETRRAMIESLEDLDETVIFTTHNRNDIPDLKADREICLDLI